MLFNQSLVSFSEIIFLKQVFLQEVVRDILQDGLETYFTKWSGNKFYKIFWKHILKDGLETYFARWPGNIFYKMVWKHILQDGLETYFTRWPGNMQIN